MIDDTWECSRCHKRIDRGRNHYSGNGHRWHIRCANEIERENRKSQAEQFKRLKLPKESK